MKKGQVQMQETILVVFIVVILIILGLIFFYRFTLSGIESESFNYEEVRFRQLISFVPGMSELKCSKLSIEEECIDVSKATVFNRYSESYFKQFGYKNITIKEVLIDQKTYGIYLREPKQYKSVEKISSLVSLYYPEKKEYGIGILTIEWYR